jgi:hypothetical protein
MKAANKNLKIAVTALFFFAATGMYTAGFSNPTTDKAKVAGQTEMAVEYIGNCNNLPVFQLNLFNKNDDVYVVVIKDLNDEVLYTETVSGKSFSRKYAFDVAATALNNISIVITGRKTNQSEVYKITSASYTYDSVSVARL